MEKIYDFILGIHWKDVGVFIAALLLVQKFAEKFFGVGPLGRKVIQGSPMIWRWLMGFSIFKKEIENKLAIIIESLKDMDTKVGTIKHEVEDNSGHSLKDAVKAQAGTIDELRIRLDIADLSTGRMVFKVNSEGACTEISETFLQLFGYAEADVLGFAFESIVHDDDVAELRVKWKRAIEQCGRFNDVQRIYHRDPNKGFVRCFVRGFPRSVKLPDGRKKLVEFIGFIAFLPPEEVAQNTLPPNL